MKIAIVREAEIISKSISVKPMAFFNSNVPLVSRKPSIDAVTLSPTVWRVRFSLSSIVFWSSFYTRHDQACLSWAVLTAGIFAIAQFFPISWSIWYGWGAMLCNLCPLWLTLCGIGYLITGVGMRSRLILLCSAIHFLVIGLLSFLPTYQLLLTGIVISGSVFLLAEFQWDSNGVCNYQTLYSSV